MENEDAQLDEAARRMGRDPIRMRIVRNVAAREEAERDLAAENEALAEQVERLESHLSELRACAREAMAAQGNMRALHASVLLAILTRSA